MRGIYAVVTIQKYDTSQRVFIQFYKMKLRARGKQGQIAVGQELNINSNNLNDLYQDLKIKLGLRELGQVKYGFPPKALEGSIDTLLFQTGLKEGDVLIIVDGKDGAVAPTATSSDSFASTEGDLQTCFGQVVARVMKDDNSCLFRSVAFLFLRNPEEHKELRSIIRNEILNAPNHFNEAILGRPVNDYCDWIQRPNSWGGAIELAIFARYFQTVIVSIDVSSGRVDRFTEGVSPSSPVAFVIYSGIHYDAVAVTPTNSVTPDDFDIVSFNQDEALEVQDKLIILAQEWKQQRKYTDLGSFTIKCGICRIGLVGQKEAQAHALASGHQSFTEY